MSLAWSDGRREDMSELQQFVCSEPPPRLAPHRIAKHVGAHWEREVQSGLRAARLPVPPDEIYLVGRDGEGIAALGWAMEVGGPDEFKILGVAVALRCRGADRGLGYGDEVVEELLSRMIERGSLAGEQRVFAWCLVHVRNADSQKLMEREGFVYMDEIEGHQRWGLPLPVPQQ